MNGKRLTDKKTLLSFRFTVLAAAIAALASTGLMIPAEGEASSARLASFDINVDSVVDNDLTKVKFIIGFTNPAGNLRGGELMVEVTDNNGITQKVRAELKKKTYDKQEGTARVKAKVVCSNSPWLEMKAWLVDSEGKKSQSRSLTVNSVPNPKYDGTYKMDWPLGVEAYRRIMNFYAYDQKGKRVQLYDYYGKIIFVEFTGMWCSPGKWMLAEVMKLHKKWGDNENVVFLTVFHEGFTIGSTVTPQDARDWIEIFEQKFPAMVSPDAEAWMLYRNPEKPDSVPQYMMVDPYGIISFKGVGWGPNFFYDQINNTIRYMVNRWFPE